MNVREARARFESDASHGVMLAGKVPPPRPPPRQVKENWVPLDARSPPRRETRSPLRNDARSPLRKPSGPQPPPPKLKHLGLPPRHQESSSNPGIVRVPLSPRIPPSPMKPHNLTPPMSSPGSRTHASPCRKQSTPKNKASHPKSTLSPLTIRTASPSSNSSRPLISPPFASFHSPDHSLFEVCEKVRPSPVKKPDLVTRPPTKPPPRKPEPRSASKAQHSTPSEMYRSFAASPKRFSPDMKHQIMSPKRTKASPSPLKSRPMEHGFNLDKQMAADKLEQLKLDVLAGSRDKGMFSPSVNANKSAEQLYDELKEGFVKKLAKEREDRMEVMAVLSVQAEEKRAIEKANLFLNHLPVEGVLTVVPHGKLKGLKPAKRRLFSLHLQTRTLSYWKDEATRLRGAAAKTLERVTTGEVSSSQAATFCVLFANRAALELKASSQREAQRWLDALDLLKIQHSPSKLHRKSLSSSGRSSGCSFSSVEKRNSVEKLHEDTEMRQQQEAIRGAFREAVRFQLVSSGNKPKAPPKAPLVTPVFALGNG